MLKTIDLCCGAGGWACATRGLPIQMVAAVDLWGPACKTYKLNSPGTTVVCGDIRNERIQERIIKLSRSVDLVLGGIPCEWLTIRRNIGKKPSEIEIERERKTLDTALELVRAINPRYWCLEDVKGLAKELPIMTPWREINSLDYSGQRRKRIYIGNFPALKPGNCIKKMNDDLRPGPYRIGKRSFECNPVQRESFAKDKCYGVFPNQKAPTICNQSSSRDPELVILDETIPGGKRQMEWQESARLQGFPEDFIFYGSPTDVHAMIGRAVQIDTARAILQAIVVEMKAKHE